MTLGEEENSTVTTLVKIPKKKGAKKLNDFPKSPFKEAEYDPKKHIEGFVVEKYAGLDALDTFIEDFLSNFDLKNSRFQTKPISNHRQAISFLFGKEAFKSLEETYKNDKEHKKTDHPLYIISRYFFEKLNNHYTNFMEKWKEIYPEELKKHEMENKERLANKKKKGGSKKKRGKEDDSSSDDDDESDHEEEKGLRRERRWSRTQEPDNTTPTQRPNHLEKEAKLPKK